MIALWERSGTTKRRQGKPLGRRGKGDAMTSRVFLSAAILGASMIGAVRADPLPEPLPVGTRLGHSVCETYLNGPHAGTRRSLICELAGRPAVLVYTHEINTDLVTLLTKLDTVARRGKEQKMKSSCVLLTTKDEDQETLQAAAKRQQFEATVLAATPLPSERPLFANSARRSKLSEEAVVTVIILDRLEVRASYAFRRGELTEKSVDEIVKAASALLPSPP